MKIDIDRAMQAIEEDNHTGFCTACGYEQGGCEPDARKYECESCGKKTVYGAEELLMMNGEIDDDDGELIKCRYCGTPSESSACDRCEP